MIYEYDIPCEILSKKNSYFHAKGRVFVFDSVDKSIKDAIKLIQADFNSRKFKAIDAPCWLKATFINKRDKDVDNQLATLFDILQTAGVVTNDKLIVEVEASKAKVQPGQSPHCVIRIGIMEEQ